MARQWSNSMNFAGLRGTPAKVGEALIPAGEMVLADSDRRVPVDTGALQRSGKVVRVSLLKVAVTYTDPKAVAAHEDLTRTPQNGREPKYLENAMNARRDEVSQVLAAAARAALR